MDRPNNLMHVNGLIGFDVLPDLETFTALVLERMVHKFRVLAQVAVERDGAWVWEDDPDFAIGRHVRRVVLDDGSDAAVRAYVSSQFSLPFDRSHPLWEMQVVSGPAADGPGGYVFSRFHHGLGDGVRLTQMLIGTCDPVEGATPPAVGRNVDRHHHPLERMVHAVRQSVTDTIDYVVILGGSAELELDDGRKQTVTTGDCVVQRGTRHAWRVTSDEPLVLAATLVGARRI